jgi:hypothetical protein
MLVRFFRGTGFGPVVLLVIIAAALWSGFFLHPPVIYKPTEGTIMPVWGFIIDALKNYPFLATVISFLLLLILIIIMGRFNTSVFFIARRTYFPGLICILIYAVFPGRMVLNPAQPAAILIMIGLWRMMTAYRKNGVAYNFFDAALIVSLAGLLYANAVWFVLLVFIGAMILRSPDIREIAAAFFGALLPWAILFAVWYLVGKSPSNLASVIFSNLFDEAPSVYWSRTLVILIGVIALVFLPSVFKLLTEMQTQKVKSRKSFSMLIWMLMISVLSFIAVPSVSVEMIAIAAIPLSYIIANYYTFTRHVVVADILLWAIMIMLVISRVWPY